MYVPRHIFLLICKKNTCFCPIFSLDNCEISWIDEDGDSINVQSSEDLVHALSGMKDTAFIKFNLLESKAVQAEVFYNFKN